jgi:hypothetical protein
MYKVTFEPPYSDRGELIIEEETWPHLPSIGTRISFRCKDQSTHKGEIDENSFEAEDYLVEEIIHAWPNDRSKVAIYLKEL